MFNKLLILSIIFLAVSLTCESQNVNTKENNDTTYMLTYDHGGQILWGLAHFREKLDEANEWLIKYPHFKIGLENEAHVYDYFAQKDPTMLVQIRRMLKKFPHRFGIGSCSYGQPLAVFINEESNIRQIKYALQADLKHFNFEPPIYLMSEHAMHSQLPQILKGFGFKGAIMRTHFMMYGYNPTFDVPIGNWVGLDRSKIATIPTYVGEGAAFGKTPIDNWTLTRYPGNDAISPQQFRDKFSHIHPLLASRDDDSGLKKEALVNEYKNQKKFQWVLLDDLLSKYPIPKTDMITKPNDFPVRMPWGYCGNEIWNESRKAEVQLLTAERLAALVYITGGKNYESLLSESWKNLLVGQHHDIQIVGLISTAKKYIPASQELSNTVLNASLHFFESKMKSEGISQVTVFNPLSWTQKKWISVKVNEVEKGNTYSYIVKCGNKEIPNRLLNPNFYSDKSILDGELYFETELPPLSITAFSVIPSKEKNPAIINNKISIDYKNLIINTPFLEIRLGEQGGIKSIKQKNENHNIENNSGSISYFEGLINGIDCKSKGNWIIQYYDSIAPFILATEYGMVGGIPYRFEIKVYENETVLDCKVAFDINGQKIGLLSDNPKDANSPFIHNQKLRFKFFPGLIREKTIGIRDLPFAISETQDSVVQGNYWTAIADSKNGVAFFNKGNMGSIRESDGSFSIPLAYAMYYVWGTRMLNGTYTYEFEINPFSGTWENADLHRKAIAYNYPVPVINTSKGNGQLGYQYNFFKGEVVDPILSAFYTENGKLITRFYEYKGIPTSLVFGNNNYVADEIDLKGKFKNKEKGSISFHAWQIKTFKFDKIKINR